MLLFLQLVELAPGTQVFLYPFMLERVECYKKYTRATKNLLGMFYPSQQLIELNKLKYLDQRVVNAVIGKLNILQHQTK